MEINFNMIGDHIVHVTTEDYKDLAKIFIRFTEHYESKYEEIRGKVFTIGQVLALGSDETKGLGTYLGLNHRGADWSGYNVPDYVFTPFIKGLFDPLTSQEQDIVEAVKRRTDKFYVIGSTTENKTVMEHEVRHALYYIYEDYRKACDKIVNKRPTERNKIFKFLNKLGYAKNDYILMDECQAYLGVDFDWLLDKMKKEFDPNTKLSAKTKEELDKVRAQYSEGLE